MSVGKRLYISEACIGFGRIRSWLKGAILETGDLTLVEAGPYGFLWLGSKRERQ